MKTIVLIVVACGLACGLAFWMLGSPCSLLDAPLKFECQAERQ